MCPERTAQCCASGSGPSGIMSTETASPCEANASAALNADCSASLRLGSKAAFVPVSDQPLPFELEYDKTIHVNALLLDGRNSEAKNSSKSIFRASAAPPIPDNHRRSRSSCSALVHAQSSC